MNRCSKLILILVLSLANTSFDNVVKHKIELNNKNNLDLTIKINPKPKCKIQRLGYEKFIDKISVLESGGITEPYKAVNRYGYMGKYQFSKRTLKGLMKTGYLKTTRKEINNFINDPELQDRAMVALINHNKDILKRYGLVPYIGKTIGGVTITMEGMLAGAHLLGPYAVKHFVKNNGSMSSVKVNGVTINKYDGNGTSIIDYMKHFA